MQTLGRHLRYSFLPVCFLFCVFSLLCAVSRQSGSVFRLQRRFKHNTSSFDSLQRLVEHDRRRHGRFLAVSNIEFPLGGIADPTVAGLYFTEVELGTPAGKYYVQVDTGSDLLWVNCASCQGCPSSSQLGVRLELYNPQSSSTSNYVECGDAFCQTSSGTCQTGEACAYQLEYGDGSTFQGYLVRDTIHLMAVVQNNSAQIQNSTVVFGCGTGQSGGLNQSDNLSVDGIMGFGPSNMSAISQLANQNVVPRVFSHCLEGEGNGGGILVIGNVVAKGLSQTSMASDQEHYNVDLTTISVGGSTNISMASGGNGGTIFDSGTTLAYFTNEVYQQLLSAIFGDVPSTDIFLWQDMACTLSSSGNVYDSFPSLTLVFGDGAKLIVRPTQYLIEVAGSSGTSYCVGFQTLQSNSLNLNILGDLVLKDRLVIYDLDQRLISWVDYDCTSNVTVATANGEQLSVSANMLPIQSISSSGGGEMRSRVSAELWWFTLLAVFCSWMVLGDPSVEPCCRV